MLGLDRYNFCNENCGGCGNCPKVSRGWRVPFERLEELVPELPLGLGEGLFEGVNLCVDVGSVVGGKGEGEWGCRGAGGAWSGGAMGTLRDSPV